jgi:hypothetical protein
VEQQLCRWLLLSHDRVKADELIMTQELIADMLGVRREGVTVGCGRLQDSGAIRYVAATSRSWTARSSKKLCANVTAWSKTSLIGCWDSLISSL